MLEKASETIYNIKPSLMLSSSMDMSVLVRLWVTWLPKLGYENYIQADLLM
jgi:hypothetical protein